VTGVVAVAPAFGPKARLVTTGHPTTTTNKAQISGVKAQ